MQPNKKKKPEISLMTILAYEATKDAQNLLAKYRRPKASSFADLEVKLAELYDVVDDKLKLEKELAAIHPHKKWIIARSTPEVKPEVKAEVKEETAVVVKPLSEDEQKKQLEDIKNELKSILKEELDKKEKTSEFAGNCHCPYCKMYGRHDMNFNMPQAPWNNPSYQEPKSNASGPNKSQDFIGVIGLVGILGIFAYVISKS